MSSYFLQTPSNDGDYCRVKKCRSIDVQEEVRLADSSFVLRSAARTSVCRSCIPTSDIASSRFVPKIISKGRSIMYCVLVVNPNSAQQCLARPAKMTVMFSPFLS